VVIWAIIGVCFLAVEIYVFGHWILGGDAYATTTGTDPVPGSVKIWAWLLQAASTGTRLAAPQVLRDNGVGSGSRLALRPIRTACGRRGVGGWP
jgi:hypothetical protein